MSLHFQTPGSVGVIISGTVAAFRLPCCEIITAASRVLAYLRDKVARLFCSSDICQVPLIAAAFTGLLSLRCI